MRVVLDTNILVSALIAPAGNPAAIYNAWEQGKFTLLTSEFVPEFPRLSAIRPILGTRL
jgi:predicted nucleic acid-binding protein